MIIILFIFADVSHLNGFTLHHNRTSLQARLILQIAVSAKNRIEALYGLKTPSTEIFLCDNATQFKRMTGRGGNTVGLAYPARRLIVLNARADPLSAPLKSLMQHELFHIAVFEFCKVHRTTIPLWLNEGLAQLTEGKDVPPDIERFLRARAAAFVATSLLKNEYPKDSYERTLFYAASLSFCRFLEEKGSWRTFFRLLSKGYNWQEALVGAFGTDLNHLSEEWQRRLGRSWSWLDTLKAVGLSGVIGILVLIAVFVFYIRYRRAKRALPDGGPRWLT